MDDRLSVARTRRSRVVLFSLLGLTLVGCTLCTLLLFGDTVTHNRALRAHVSAFKMIEHPSDTTSVVRKARVGLQVGNGNHCDYFVGELRTYDGDRQAIEAAYAGQRPGGEIAWLAVVFVDAGVIPPEAGWDLPQGLDSLRGWSRRLADSREY